MKVEDTKIQTAGVMRCCLESVAREYLGTESRTSSVEEGAQSVCEHCGTPFRLVGIAWQPLWMLEGA